MTIRKCLRSLAIAYFALLAAMLQAQDMGSTAVPTTPGDDFGFDEYSDVEFELEIPQEESTVKEGAGDTISVDYPDAPIRNVLRSVADLYGLNIVIPDALQGNTSIKLDNVTWRQIFDVVLEQAGFAYFEDGNIIKIKSMEDLAMEPLDTRVFIIDFADATQLSEAVAPLVDASVGGRVQVETRSNALVVSERPSRMSTIQDIISRLDRPTPQVSIESKFVEVKDRFDLNLGFDYSDSIATTAQGSTSNSSPDNNFREGLLASTAANAAAKYKNSILSTTTVTATLNIMEKKQLIKTYTNPILVTMNNVAARIAIGDRYPIPEYTYNDQTGNYAVSGFEYIDIGTNLLVTPQVNSAGFITLRVVPEISSQNGTVNFEAGGSTGATIPIINSTRTESTVNLKDGFTLAIGGLSKINMDRTENRVPFLSSIPVIGKILFTNKVKDNDMEDVLVFITAKVLNPDGSTYMDVVDSRKLDRLELDEQDMPGYNLPEDTSQQIEAIRKRRQSQYEADYRESVAQKRENMIDQETKKMEDDRNDKSFTLRYNKPKPRGEKPVSKLHRMR